MDNIKQFYDWLINEWTNKGKYLIIDKTTRQASFRLWIRIGYSPRLGENKIVSRHPTSYSYPPILYRDYEDNKWINQVLDGVTIIEY